MSAWLSQSYCECGEPVRGAPAYCKHCGRRLGELGDKPLETIASAVREVTETASDAKREGKSHQQRWGLFETNYQREKGISTEESLREIEEFSREGVLPEPAPRKSHIEGPGHGAFRADLNSTIQRGEEKRRGSGNQLKRLSQRIARLGRPSGAAAAGASRPAAPRTFKDEFAAKLTQPSSTAGTAALDQYLSNERKKFQPTHGM